MVEQSEWWHRVNDGNLDHYVVVWPFFLLCVFVLFLRILHTAKRKNSLKMCKRLNRRQSNNSSSNNNSKQ